MSAPVRLSARRQMFLCSLDREPTGLWFDAIRQSGWIRECSWAHRQDFVSYIGHTVKITDAGRRVYVASLGR